MRLSNIVLGGVSAMLQIHSAGAIPVNASSSKMPLERRWSLDVESVNCHKEWLEESVIRDHLAYGDYIQEGIDYLRNIPLGKPKLGPGPGNCQRVSCTWNAAIYWCNENPAAAKELDCPPATKAFACYATIAEAAEIIQDRCKLGEGTYIMGQVFMKDQWSVSITKDDC